MKFWLLCLLIPFAFFAQEHKQRIAPEEIQSRLEEAEAQYDHALTLFNPWYTGPLITPSATMIDPGQAMLQPYMYFTDNYGAFNEDREWIEAPNQFIIKPQPIILQVGVTPSVDALVIMGTLAQWKKEEFSGGFQDTILQIGFLVNKQTPWVPKAKFSIGETCPSGKYKNLNPKNLGLDATGGGAWGTTFTLVFGKVLFWNTLHPVNTRISFQYTINTPVHVTNFNAYGGGYGTKGTVHPGNGIAIDLGLEVSINQPWAVALDVVYTGTNRTTFNGHPGTTTLGGTTPASVGSGYSDQLSLAPAFEFNFNANMGLVMGTWFTVYGRNAANFVSGIFSWYWVFP